jgi:tetratricopeptide (TPR) repeat protein
MTIEIFAYTAIVIITALLVRIPFLNFPIDEDMATYTYLARFATKGFKWKQDMYSFYPIWRMRVLDSIYGSQPERGIYRIRIFLMICHIFATVGVFATVWVFSGNALAALISGVLYSFLGVSPAFSAESFNFEQVFLPFVIWGVLCFGLGTEWYWISGLLFGIAAVAKCSVPVFSVFLAGLAIYWDRPESAISFITFAFLPLVLSHLMEWRLGYLDEEGQKQFKLRLAATLRCSQLKRIYGSIVNDIATIAKQTLPLWLLGWPSLAFNYDRPNGVLMVVVVATALFMIVCQKGFSRYHYIPLTAFLAISVGLGMDRFWDINQTIGIIAIITLVISTIWVGVQMAPYLFKANDVSILSRYDKFEQLIYLPLLGKSLRRLIRKNKEENRRLFVWGNFVQLYHETNLPASDQFVHYCIGPWNEPILADYFDTVIGGLLRHKPVYLIKTYPNFDMERLQAITGLNYKLIKIAFGRYPLYRLENHDRQVINPLSFSSDVKLKLMAELTENAPLIPIVDKTDGKMGSFSQGIKECKRALRANPYDIEITKYLAELYDQSGKHDKAIKTLEILIDLRPETSHLRLVLSSMSLKQDKINEAELLIKEEKKHFGQNAETNYHEGLLASAKGDNHRAANLFQQFLETKAFRMDVWLKFAQVNEECGDINNAKNVYLDLWDRANETEDADWIRTQCALALARLDEGFRLSSQSLQYFFQKDPGNEQLAYAYASALENEGNINQARSLFENFVQTFRRSHLLAAAWFRLARLTESEEKEYMLKKCFELNPLHSGAERELQNMEEHFAEA